MVEEDGIEPSHSGLQNQSRAHAHPQDSLSGDASPHPRYSKNITVLPGRLFHRLAAPVFHGTDR